MQIRKALIIQTAFTGDVVLATPVIERLWRCYPDAEIHFLLRKGNEGLLEGHPHVSRVIIRDKKVGKVKSLLQVLKAVRQEKYDLVVNLHRFASSGLIAGFSGAKHVCGFDKNPFSWRYHHKVKHVIAPGTHEVDRNQEAIAHLTTGAPDSMRLYPSAQDFDAVQMPMPYVCMAPTSVWFTKQWPADKWVQLIQSIPENFRIYLLGGPADRQACEDILQASGRTQVENLAGKLSYLQSAALMARATMNYTNDSAPLHFASAMRTPVRAIFCSTIPDFGFGPTEANGKVVQTNLTLDCRPCGLHGKRACPKGHFQCAEITMEQVLEGLD